MESTKKLTRSALLIALGVIIPYIFHTIGISGRIFLPMHFPPLLAGFLIGPFYALAVGTILPVINFLISGFPQMPTLALMIAELAVFGLVTGLLYKKTNLFISLISAMILGRIVYTSLYIAFIEFENFFISILGGITTGLPGIIAQLIIIPPAVLLIEREYFNKK